MPGAVFISDDGRIVVNASQDFEGEAEIVVGDAAPFPFDSSILVAIGEHYFFRALERALDQVKYTVADLYRLGDEERKAAVQELGENIKQLFELHKKQPENLKYVIRCPGCGQGYDPPLMNGYTCLECGSTWNAEDEKWTLSAVAQAAQASVERANTLPDKPPVPPGTEAGLNAEEEGEGE